jgi:serralysin
VAEDFAPFNVDVTTEDPTLGVGAAALAYSGSTSDASWGIRVCIGGTSSDWFGGGAGGVAYLGSFTWNTDTPCFVFSKELGPDYAKYIWEATSHEVGHAVNLQHDGTSTLGYYAGALPAGGDPAL